MNLLLRLAGSLTVMCVLNQAGALPLSSGISALSSLSEEPNSLLHKTYMYAEQPKDRINWMYIGMAPRMNDPDRVKVIVSKRGFTMRVQMKLLPEDILAYPEYLISRAAKVDQIVQEQRLRFSQERRYKAYQGTIAAIQKDWLQIPEGDLQARYRYAFKLLEQFFPTNVFEVLAADGAVDHVDAHFVYPVTIHVSKTWPPAGLYKPYTMEERRAFYSKDPGSFIFGGFPAFWLDPKGAGTGIHGPIRYSTQTEARRDGRRGGMGSFWAENNFLNETISPTDELNPRYRWDLVRKADSHGCFRAETVELRHLLPADPALIVAGQTVVRNAWEFADTDPRSVSFLVINDFDRITVPGKIKDKIVNVAYYLTSPYERPNKTAWLRSMFLSETEQRAKDWQSKLNTFVNDKVYTFDYLNPMVLEFRLPSGAGSNSVMGLLNRAQ